jgi:hypothetical protein
LKWTPSVGATGYDLWVDELSADKSSTIQSQVIRQQNLVNPSFTPTSNLADGNYRVWVRAFNQQGSSAWSAPVDESIVASLTPTIISPLPVIPNAAPSFAWTPVSGALSYDLWVDDLTTGQSQVIRQPTLATNTFTPVTGLAVGTYRVWVRSESSGGFSPWSKPVDFSVAPLAVPTNLSVTAGATPTFTWGAVSGATAYDLWVDDLTTGVSQVIRQPTLSIPTFTQATALASGNYRVWVRAFGSQGFGDWSNFVDFTV